MRRARNNGKVIKPGTVLNAGAISSISGGDTWERYGGRNEKGQFVPDELPDWIDDYVRASIVLGPYANDRQILKLMNLDEGDVTYTDIRVKRKQAWFLPYVKNAVEKAIKTSQVEALWILRQIYQNEDNDPSVRIRAIQEFRGWYYGDKQIEEKKMDRGFRAAKTFGMDTFLNVLESKISLVRKEPVETPEVVELIEEIPADNAGQ